MVYERMIGWPSISSSRGDKLPRLEKEHDRLVGHETEGAHVPGFLDDFDATDNVSTIGPGLETD